MPPRRDPEHRNLSAFFPSQSEGGKIWGAGLLLSLRVQMSGSLAGPQVPVPFFMQSVSRSQGLALGSASCLLEHNLQLALQLHPELPALNGFLSDSKATSLSWTGYSYSSLCIPGSKFGNEVYLGLKEPPLLPTTEGLKCLAILEILCWFYQLQEIISKFGLVSVANSFATVVMLSSKKQFLYIWQVFILLSSQLPLIVLAKQPLTNHL